MVERVSVSEADLRRLLEAVEPARCTGPGAEVPDSSLRDLPAALGCDFASLQVTNLSAHTEFVQCPAFPDDKEFEDDPEFDRLSWLAHEEAFSYPQRSGDYVSVTRSTDTLPGVTRGPHFWAFVDACGSERRRWLAALVPLPPDGPVDRRLLLWRTDGSDFTDRDVLLLTLLRPHVVALHERQAVANTGVPHLSPRQWEVLRLVAAGRTNTQIAHLLAVAEGTVRKHLENIYALLDANSRTEAVLRVGPLLTDPEHGVGASAVRTH